MLFSNPTYFFINMMILVLLSNIAQIQSQTPGYDVVCCDKVNDICGGNIDDLKCRKENSTKTFPYTCNADEEKPQCLKGGDFNQQVCVNFGQLTCKKITESC